MAGVFVFVQFGAQNCFFFHQNYCCYFNLPLFFFKKKIYIVKDFKYPENRYHANQHHEILSATNNRGLILLLWIISLVGKIILLASSLGGSALVIVIWSVLTHLMDPGSASR